MEMLFVGDLGQYANATKFYHSLQELGHDVTGISTTHAAYNVIADGYTKIDALFYRLGYPIDKAGTNRQVKEWFGQGHRPEMMWIFKAAVLRPNTLHFIREISPQTKLIFVSFDNQLAAHNTPKTLGTNLRLVDFVFVNQRGRDDKRLLETQFRCRRVEYFVPGYDKKTIVPRNRAHDDRDLDFDVSFIGSYELARARDLAFLADRGLFVTVFGNNWDQAPNWIRNSSLRIQYRPLLGAEFVDVLHRSKIALNFLRKVNNDVATTRTFEIPGSGTFMLAERTWAHSQYYVEGNEAEYFSNPDELLAKARYYLDHSDERERIARAGLLRTQLNGYDYHAQLQNILNIIAKG